MKALEELEKIDHSVSMLKARIKQIKEMLQAEMRSTETFKGAPVYMNKTQAAHYLGVTPRTISRWEKDGRLKFTNGRVHRSMVADVARGKRQPSHLTA